MIPHPTYALTDPCEALGCAMRQHDIRFCTEQYCPHRWQRQAAQDKARDKEREEREKEAKRRYVIVA